jgi:hypothetical protein
VATRRVGQQLLARDDLLGVIDQVLEQLDPSNPTPTSSLE